MKTQEIRLKDSRGNLSSMYYSPYAHPQVVTHLEDKLHTNIRIRVWYGDTDRPDFERVHGRKPDPGKDWGEENDVTGTVGCSTGPIKIPLLIHNSRSMGGGAILTDCIIRIMVSGGYELYRHPNFHSDYDSATVEPSELAPEYSHAVIPHSGEWAGQEIARFHSERSAVNYLAFMRGERMSK